MDSGCGAQLSHLDSSVKNSEYYMRTLALLEQVVVRYCG